MGTLSGPYGMRHHQAPPGQQAHSTAAGAPLTFAQKLLT